MKCQGEVQVLTGGSPYPERPQRQYTTEAVGFWVLFSPGCRAWEDGQVSPIVYLKKSFQQLRRVPTPPKSAA